MNSKPLIVRLLILIVLVGLLLTGLKSVPVGQQINLGLAPIISIIQTPVRIWQSIRLWFVDSALLQQQLLDTQEQLEKQAALIQQTQNLLDENKQLRSLLKLTNINGYQWHTAQVLGRSPDKKSQHLILETAHASPDNAVVSREGLVGIVDQANAQTASVRTILDASVAVPVTLPNSALAALVRGQGDHLLVDFVPKTLAPAIGDILQTSGAGGLFPSGIAVARVTQVMDIPGQVFVNVEASPTSHWQRDRWLAIASRLQPTAQLP